MLNKFLYKIDNFWNLYKKFLYNKMTIVILRVFPLWIMFFAFGIAYRNTLYIEIGLVTLEIVMLICATSILIDKLFTVIEIVLLKPPK